MLVEAGCCNSYFDQIDIWSVESEIPVKSWLSYLTSLLLIDNRPVKIAMLVQNLSEN